MPICSSTNQIALQQASRLLTVSSLLSSSCLLRRFHPDLRVVALVPHRLLQPEFPYWDNSIRIQGEFLHRQIISPKKERKKERSGSAMRQIDRCTNQITWWIPPSTPYEIFNRRICALLIPIRQEERIICEVKDEREEKVSKRKGIRATNRSDNDEEIESTRRVSIHDWKRKKLRRRGSAKKSRKKTTLQIYQTLIRGPSIIISLQSANAICQPRFADVEPALSQAQPSFLNSRNFAKKAKHD
jgi:hypothetical protein